MADTKTYNAKGDDVSNEDLDFFGIETTNFETGEVDPPQTEVLYYPVDDLDRYHAHITFSIYEIEGPEVKSLGLYDLIKGAFTFRDGENSTEQDEIQSKLNDRDQTLIDDLTDPSSYMDPYQEPAQRKSNTPLVLDNFPEFNDTTTTSSGKNTVKQPAATSINNDTNTTLTPRQENFTGKQVRLYMPVAFTSSDTIQYENPSLGLMGATVENLLNAGSDKVASAVLDRMSQGVEGIKELLGVSGSSGASAGAARVLSKGTLAKLSTKGNLLGGTAEAIGSAARVTINPNIRTVFRGVTIRTFTFDFKFISKSQYESEMIESIIKRFRVHAHPETESLGADDILVDALYNFPDMFTIDVMFDDGNISRRIGPRLKKCYLSAIRTTYNATSMAFHEDGRPVEVDLSLTFMEEIPLDKKDVRDEGY